MMFKAFPWPGMALWLRSAALPSRPPSSTGSLNDVQPSAFACSVLCASSVRLCADHPPCLALPCSLAAAKPLQHEHGRPARSVEGAAVVGSNDEGPRRDQVRPEEPRLHTRPAPARSGGARAEVLIRVRYADLNPVDLHKPPGEARTA
ncbi:hypothetical protein THAOC_37275, partial [Thalassiosira oceanica]